MFVYINVFVCREGKLIIFVGIHHFFSIVMFIFSLISKRFFLAKEDICLRFQTGRGVQVHIYRCNVHICIGIITIILPFVRNRELVIR